MSTIWLKSFQTWAKVQASKDTASGNIVDSVAWWIRFTEANRSFQELSSQRQCNWHIVILASGICENSGEPWENFTMSNSDAISPLNSKFLIKLCWVDIITTTVALNKLPNLQTFCSISAKNLTSSTCIPGIQGIWKVGTLLKNYHNNRTYGNSSYSPQMYLLATS
jgi:hypothetical protein